MKIARQKKMARRTDQEGPTHTHTPVRLRTVRLRARASPGGGRRTAWRRPPPPASLKPRRQKNQCLGLFVIIEMFIILGLSR